jgi:hypothetical protein
MNELMEIWDRVFWVPFAALAAFLVYRWFKFRGLRGMPLSTSEADQLIALLQQARSAPDRATM